MEYFDYLPSLADEEKKRLFHFDKNNEAYLENLKKLSKYKLTLLENIKLGRQVEKLSDTIGKCTKYCKVHLGIIGNFTFSHLKNNMIAAAFRRGILLDIQFAPYDSLYPMALGEIQPFEGKIDYLLIYMSPENYYVSNIPICDIKNELISLINKIKLRYNSRIILSNYNRRFYDNTSSINILNNSFDDFIEQYNTACRDIVKSNDSLLLLNIDKVANIVGLQKWINPVDYYRSKIPFAYECTDVFSDYFSRMLGAYLGIRKKIIVLDLDGVLWGGILGDDGINNIVIGNGSAEGEAFMAFQQYLLKELYDTGIVLTVVSKNSLENVNAVLENCPGMILKREHFAMLQVNWKDKASNIKAIVDTLNVGLDSIVFIDDNVYERNLIQEKLPLVTTIDIGNNPSNYTAILANSGYFDYYDLSQEDFNRTKSYINKVRSVEIQDDFPDYTSYLRFTNMQLIISPFQNGSLTRIIQLINKTNQFNLVCTKVNYQDIEKVLESDYQLGIQISLQDKFENFGIISILILAITQHSLSIDIWVMSCRVFNRNIEEAVFNYLYQFSKQRGLSKIIGKCRNIKKNSYVDQLYIKRGFDYIGMQDDVAIYELSIENFKLCECAISDIVIRDL